MDRVLSARAGAIDDNLVREIIAATERGPSNHDYGVGGHEAFTSIVFAPKVRALVTASCCTLHPSSYSAPVLAFSTRLLAGIPFIIPIMLRQ